MPETLNPTPHAYICAFGEAAELAALALAERLRDELPGLRLLVNAGGGSFRVSSRRPTRAERAMR